MAHRTSDNADVLLAEPQAKPHSSTDSSQRPDLNVDIHAVPGRSVYCSAADALLPRLLRINGAEPWLANISRDGRAAQRSAPTVYREQAAGVAIGLACELAENQPDRDYLQQVVRASLIHWQLSLRCDGRPSNRGSRRSPQHGVIASQIVQLLSETTVFQTDLLLSDIERHLRWLTRQPQRTPWIEAAIACALADGAVLVRDVSLLTAARRRLHVLLKQQDDEGWFPERGGADIGRLSLTIDALARTYLQNSWDELEEALRRALNFLIHFVHPDGTVGGCYSSCGTAFMSPYGVELLASKLGDAAALAAACRRRYQRLAQSRFNDWHDDLCVAVGSGLAQTAAVASPRLPAASTYPHQVRGHVNFPNAGVSIFSTDAYHAVIGGRNGGALHVTWRSGASGLDEPGVTVVSSLSTRTAGRWDRTTCTNATSSSVTSHGVLRRVGPARRRRRRLSMKKWLRRSAPDLTVGRAHSDSVDHDSQFAEHKRLGRDRYHREITLGDESIKIRDIIRCRLPCRTILCRSASALHAWRFVDRDGTSRPGCAPIFVDGGKYVEIIRTYRTGKLIDQRSAMTDNSRRVQP